MKSTKLFTLLIISLLFYNCDSKENTNKLVLKIDAVIQKTDSINVYYTTNKGIDFTDKQSIWKKISGSKKNQTISIIFPDSIKPKQIRIDFGRNKKQPEIILNEIAFFYKKERFTAKGEEVYFLFRVDESNTVIDKLVGSLKRKEPNQATGPSLYPKGDKLFNRLTHLYSKK